MTWKRQLITKDEIDAVEAAGNLCVCQSCDAHMTCEDMGNRFPLSVTNQHSMKIIGRIAMTHESSLLPSEGIPPGNFGYSGLQAANIRIGDHVHVRVRVTSFGDHNTFAGAGEDGTEYHNMRGRDIVKIEDRPLQVGSIVTVDLKNSGDEYEVIAIDGADAFCRDVSLVNIHDIFAIKSLKVVR